MPVKLGVTCGGDLWSREDILATEVLEIMRKYWSGEHFAGEVMPALEKLQPGRII